MSSTSYVGTVDKSCRYSKYIYSCRHIYINASINLFVYDFIIVCRARQQEGDPRVRWQRGYTTFGDSSRLKDRIARCIFGRG